MLTRHLTVALATVGLDPYSPLSPEQVQIAFVLLHRSNALPSSAQRQLPGLNAIAWTQ